MTEQHSVEQIQILTEMLPGISSAKFSRSGSDASIFASVRCVKLAGFDAIARCSTGANVNVSLGQSESVEFRKLGSVTGLVCQITFKDSDDDKPSECEIFGFYTAILLYNSSLVDDDTLDYLESIWNVNSSENRRLKNRPYFCK